MRAEGKGGGVGEGGESKHHADVRCPWVAAYGHVNGLLLISTLAVWPRTTHLNIGPGWHLVVRRPEAEYHSNQSGMPLGCQGLKTTGHVLPARHLPVRGLCDSGKCLEEASTVPGCQELRP